jgi:predicted enzyme related to lactoylglutathione lyase
MIKTTGTIATIMVKSMSKAIRFYTGVLGMKLKVQYGSHWAEVTTKGLTIGLHPAGKNKIKFGDNMSLGLGVKDMETAVAHLKEAGVKCEIEKDSYVHLAHFQDPDGNWLYLYKEK